MFCNSLLLKYGGVSAVRKDAMTQKESTWGQENSSAGTEGRLSDVNETGNGQLRIEQSQRGKDDLPYRMALLLMDIVCVYGNFVFISHFPSNNPLVAESFYSATVNTMSAYLLL